MSTKESVEERIRQVISTAKNAFSLSDQLFSPEGLFSHLGSTKAARAKLVQSPLFREAQKKFHDLQQKEAAAFFGRARTHHAANARKKRRSG